MSLATLANLLRDVLSSCESADVHGRLNIEQLEIAICGEDSNLQHWLEAGFGFTANTESMEATDTYRVAAFCRDRWLAEIIALSDSDQFDAQMFSRRFDLFNRISITGNMSVDYFPAAGVAWVTDQEKCVSCLIYSSRTALPMLELRLGMIDIINRHLETNGWHTFHSGACRLHDKVFMVTGDSGAGKTTLLVNLLQQGAAYIANERLFVKQTDDRIHIRAFPQTIGIGMGTAMQVPGLGRFIERPDHLSYYQKVFEPERVWSTPPEHLAELPDKLKFLPAELTKCLDAPPPESNAMVDGILLPQLDPNAPQSATAASAEAVFETLARNYFAAANDQLYPRWLPLKYEFVAPLDPQSITQTVSELPAWQINYFIDDESKANELVALISNL